MVTDPNRWSAIGSQEHDWQFTPGSTISRAERLAGAGPYKATVVPHIADTAILHVSGETLTLLTEAAGEIARFDAEAGVEIAPFAAILLRSESFASSKIENLSATAKSIFLAELGDPSRRNANIIVANTNAMRAALELAENLDAAALLAMHHALLDGSQPIIAGRWRQEQVWIGGGDHSPHSALFIPPHHADVPADVDDLIRFVNRDNLPPLAQAAIAHAQFETIHPFADGNGRVGRALLHSILRGKGLTRNVTVPVSAGLLADIEAYFDALTSYREGDHEPIVALTAQASFRAIDNGRTLVGDISATRNEWRSKLTARKDAAVWRLVDLAVRQPVLDSEIVQRELGVAAHNANTALSTLESIGAIKQVAGNYRNRKWAASEVLAALDRFAERAGRRQRQGRYQR